MYTEEQKIISKKITWLRSLRKKLLSYIDYQLHNTELPTHSQKQNR